MTAPDRESRLAWQAYISGTLAGMIKRETRLEFVTSNPVAGWTCYKDPKSGRIFRVEVREVDSDGESDA